RAVLPFPTRRSSDLHGGEGIGLFRTEFLYMSQRELPSEEEQFTAYWSVLEQMEDKPVAIRTLDVGGDKQLNYLNMPTELNPFLRSEEHTYELQSRFD